MFSVPFASIKFSIQDWTIIWCKFYYYLFKLHLCIVVKRAILLFRVANISKLLNSHGDLVKTNHFSTEEQIKQIAMKLMQEEDDEEDYDEEQEEHKEDSTEEGTLSTP